VKFSSTVKDTFDLPTGNNDAPDPACWFTSYLSLKETATVYDCIKNINTDKPLMLTGKLFSESYAAPASGIAEFVLNLECAEQNCAATFGGDDCRFDTGCGALGIKTSDMIREMSEVRLRFMRGQSLNVSAALPHYTLDFLLKWEVAAATTTAAIVQPTGVPTAPGPTVSGVFTPVPGAPTSVPQSGLPLASESGSFDPTVSTPDGAPDNTVTIVIAVVVGLVVCLLIVLAIVYVVVRNRNQQQTYPYPNDPYATSQHSMMVGNNQPPHSMMIQQQQFGTQQQYSSTGYQSSNSTLPQMNGYAGGSHVQPYADMPSGHHTAASFSQQPPSYYGSGSIEGMGAPTGGYTDIMRQQPIGNTSAADLPDLPNSSGAMRPW
jgi:hypothetical protein